ncbi:MAG: Fe-S cluster assembly protein SufD [Gemmatimonadetes bacterium]|nr:Fe-S cluster assembly protein SufD [Gemmatimonadota bacterium]
MTTKTKTAAASPKQDILDQYEAFRAGGATASDWLAPVREAAMAQFREQGIPTTKWEDYRFTNLAPIERAKFRHASTYKQPDEIADTAAPMKFEEETSVELVFGNGRLMQTNGGDALPGGVLVMSLAEAMKKHADIVKPHLAKVANLDSAPLAALNTAFIEDGLFVYVPKGVHLEKPVHAIFVTDSGGKSSGAGTGEERMVSHPRTLIVLGESAEARVYETFTSREGDAFWSNPVTEAVVGENARLEHLRFQDESNEAFHTGTVEATQERSSWFTTYSFAFGSRLTRNDVNLALLGEGIESDLDGLYIASGTQLIDHHTFVDHREPNCESREFYKGILDDKATGVFNGKIMVHQKAQKTDAKQTNRNLLLSDSANVHTKPQLEIFADDVKCTHGATIGQIDADSLFYLETRGIDEVTARSLLIYAFAGEVVERVSFPPMRERLQNLLYDRLPNGDELRELGE